MVLEIEGEQEVRQPEGRGCLEGDHDTDLLDVQNLRAVILWEREKRPGAEGISHSLYLAHLQMIPSALSGQPLPRKHKKEKSFIVCGYMTRIPEDQLIGLNSLL